MKATDLRIGNLVKNEDGTVCEIEAYQLGASFINDFYPITLTEEIIMKCGAVKGDGHIRYSRFKLHWKDVYKFWFIVDSQSHAYMTKIEFVHEWQNFVFIMDGEELKIE